jgi:hypothetical protein
MTSCVERILAVNLPRIARKFLFPTQPEIQPPISTKEKGDRKGHIGDPSEPDKYYVRIECWSCSIGFEVNLRASLRGATSIGSVLGISSVCGSDFCLAKITRWGNSPQCPFRSHNLANDETPNESRLLDKSQSMRKERERERRGGPRPALTTREADERESKAADDRSRREA